MILYSIRHDGRLCDPLCADSMDSLRNDVKRMLDSKLLRDLGLSIKDFEIVLLGNFESKSFDVPILLTPHLRYIPVRQFLKKGGLIDVQTQE